VVGKKLVASPLVGDGRLTAVGGKPRRYHFNPQNSPFAAVPLFAIRHSLLAAVFGSALASPSHLSTEVGVYRDKAR